MELQVAVAKISKYAVRESGDTLEMIERPHGGLSFVLVPEQFNLAGLSGSRLPKSPRLRKSATPQDFVVELLVDGQHTGRGAKAISNLVARKAVTLLGEGVRDGAAARAAHDYLFTHYDGKVSAELHIVSIDLVSKTIVISRNSHCPAIVGDCENIKLIDEPSKPIGVHRRVKPVISELPLKLHTTIVVFTDGILNAGIRTGKVFDIKSFVEAKVCDVDISAQALADSVLARSIELDDGRPNDDTSVLVVRVVPFVSSDEARRMSVRFPIR